MVRQVFLVNAGSSSLKTALYDAGKLVVRSHYDGKTLRVTQKRTQKLPCEIIDAAHALRHNVEFLTEKGLLDPEAITTVGHRVVHGGEYFKKATKITPTVKEKIGALSILAPLHNPANLASIRMAEKLFPGAKHVAVFDTAYHQTIPEAAFRYGIPTDVYKKYKVRKYGFHGTSHKYLAREAQRVTKKKKIITCHIGNGSSVTANKNGKSIDTSMGFTPTDGLIMGTRVGAIDPEAILYLLKFMQASPERMHQFLNQESGLLGVGHYTDVRELWENRKKKDAQLALDMLAYDTKKYISQYFGVLNGADVIVFSGGIGENAWYVREATLEGLNNLGIRLDKKKNKKVINPTKPVAIHARSSEVKILVIPTNEEQQMLEEI